MGLILNKNIFGPRVKYSADVKKINDNEILIPDWFEGEIDGKFTNSEGLTDGDLILNGDSKGLQIENLLLKPTSRYNLFRNVTARSDDQGGEKEFSNVMLKIEDFKYLYDNSDLPLRNYQRLFVKIGKIEYRISKVNRRGYRTFADTIHYEYEPILALCHEDGNSPIKEFSLYNTWSSNWYGNDINTSLKPIQADLNMTILKITNFDPTVIVQNYGSRHYTIYLNGYLKINGELSQPSNGHLYIPIFYTESVYSNTTNNTQFVIQPINYHEPVIADSDIRLSAVRQVLKYLQTDTNVKITFPNSQTRTNETEYVTTTMSGYTPEAEGFISDTFNFKPNLGIHIGWTYDDPNDNIVYNTLEATEYEPEPEPDPDPNPDPNPEPNPEEPLEPEVVEPAVDPNTDYTPPLQEAFEEFPYRGSDTISGLEPNYNLFRPSYSNYIFPKYYRDSIEGDSDWESAITFIQEACNPSSFELWGTAFKLITGHPTPEEIISRVYYLPFEYTEIRGTESAGFYFSAPVYGPIGPVTLGVKTHSEDPSNTGKPVESNVHYYQQIVNRFKTINLGQVTIDRVFNNFLDYSEVKYTLNLPYGAGQVELDPDLLFKNDISVGNVKLTGVIDFDTGELTIIIQLNGQRYYETTVNIAIDRLASVADNMAAPLAIAKASMAAGAAAGGFTKFIGGRRQFNSNQTYDERNAKEINRLRRLADSESENEKSKGGK